MAQTGRVELSPALVNLDPCRVRDSALPDQIYF